MYTAEGFACVGLEELVLRVRTMLEREKVYEP